MHYSAGAMWRPLFETQQTMLQLGTGCSHNACKFCTMYKKTRFSPSPREEVEADIDELARYWIDPSRIFLTGGNAFGLPQDHLVFALELIRDKVPTVESIGCFARVGDVKGKSDSELAELAALRIDDISIGAETGYDPALAFMGKGHTAADIVEQCARLDDAGIGYDLFYLAGIAGAGKWQENVQATVEVFSQCHPRRIMIHTLTLFDGAPIQHDIEEGRFTPSDELDILRELRMLNELLPNKVYMLGAHHGNAAPYNAWLPENREEILAHFDHVIESCTEKRLKVFRASITSM